MSAAQTGHSFVYRFSHRDKTAPSRRATCLAFLGALAVLFGPLVYILLDHSDNAPQPTPEQSAAQIMP